MANECYTIYKVTGNTNQVNDLYAKMKNITQKHDSSIWANDFFSAINNSNNFMYARCRIYDDFEIENNVLTFITTSAWNRCNDIEYYIKEAYPLLDVYFFEQDACGGLFRTNDVSSKFFSERYLLYNYSVKLNFTDLDSLLSYASEIFKTEIKSVDTLKQIIINEELWYEEVYVDNSYSTKELHDEEIAYTNMMIERAKELLFNAS